MLQAAYTLPAQPINRPQTAQEARQEADAEFYARYQCLKMPQALTKFIDQRYPANPSRHLSALRHFLSIAAQAEDEDHTQPMIFGMIIEAWRQFKDEQYPTQPA